MTSKHFCDSFLKQSKTSYTTSPRSKPSSLSSSSNILFKTHYIFFAVAEQVKELCFQWFQCFKCSNSNALNERSLPLNSLKRIDVSILSQNYSERSCIYLFGDTNFNFSVNTITLNAPLSNIYLKVRYLKTTFNVSRNPSLLKNLFFSSAYR